MSKKAMLFLMILFLSECCFSQTQTPVYLSQTITNANSKGFYQYLPAGYATSTKNYPLIIWVHGAGQVGQGNITDLPKILEWGVPKIISENGFPSSFTVGDSSYSFIIISPQFIGWPSGANVGAMITYAMNNYRVNPDRVYLMGISAGGGGVWEFASGSVSNSNKLAAIIPFCGTLAPTQALANNIAASNLPVWAFHNTNDGTVPVAYSRNWKNYINAYVPNPNPLAKLTEFPVVSSDAVIAHECWSLATLPTYKPQGINIYEWLLGYRKRSLTINLPPLASAGQDQGIVLPANALLDGSGSADQDGIITAYKWRKIAGPTSYIFSDSTLIKPTVSNLVQGIYQFELTVTDNLGALSKDSLIVNAYASLPSGAQQRILIDVGGTANYGGTITTSPSINGNVWNNMTDARPGIRVSNALTINNQLSGINLTVVNRVDGTYSTSSLGIGNGNTAGIVSDYPASATTDHALIHSSATNGKWKINGLQPGKIYTVKFWGTRSNTTASRTAEIKRSDDNVWKSYTATNNTNYNNAAVFNITGKTEMDFDIRTKVGSDFSAINVVDISYGTDTVVIVAPPINLPPVARAGSDISLQLPTDSCTLNGCLSSDPELGLLKYKWRKISGPTTYQLSADTLCSVLVKGMIAGTYIFELMVTDTAGLIGKDSVSIILNALIPTNWPAFITPICNRPYKIVVVGSSTAYGTGASPIDSSWVNKFRSYVMVQNQEIQVFNIATLGLTSYDVLPSGSIVPLPFTVDTLRNISKALSLNPDAIILNLPSNDVARGIPTNTIHLNYNTIAEAAAVQNVPIWVTTTQPRDGLSASERILQMDLRDWINTTYGNKSVDFWSTIANVDGTINSYYSAGDGVHLNNYGHHVIFTRMVEEKVWDSICLRKNKTPIAKAGNDTSFIGSTITLNLNGSASFDPDGIITSYNWRILNNVNGSLSLSNTASPVFSASSSGNYLIELKVTDNLGQSGYDSINIHINTPNVIPIANAGSDIILPQTLDSIQLNGSTSSDPDGIITKLKWKQLDGAALTLLNDSISRPWVRNLLAGTYHFVLTVTDDSLAINRDTMMLLINAVPISNAGQNQTITLPNNIVQLNGIGSADADGIITKFRWKKISGAGIVSIADSTAQQTNVTFNTADQYQFELTVTDNMGAIGKDTVLITVSPDPNNPPIAIAGVDQIITLPNSTTNLNGAASYDNDGTIAAYKWRRIPGTGTAIIADSLAVITQVNFSVNSEYLFELSVTDNLGSIAKDTLKITVNPDPNLPPVSNAGPDANIQLPINKILLNGRNSFDPEALAITFSWTLVTGPAGSQILTSNKDTTSVSFINAGTYTFKLTVTDAAGLTGTDNVTVNVLPVPDATKKIKVNIYGGTNPYTNTQWNNWNIFSSATSSKFFYDDLSQSNINVVTTAVGSLADNGTNYATTTTVCPYEVLRYNSANSSKRTLTFSGFNTTKQYSFEFYASRTNTGNSSVFIINNKYDTISTSGNINDYAKFSNISPAANGKIVVDMRTIGTWNYLAGFIITEQQIAAPLVSFNDTSNLSDLSSVTTNLNIEESKNLSLEVHPNPANDVIYLKIPAGIKGKYSITLINKYGQSVWYKNNTKNVGSFTETINMKNFQNGVYILRLNQQNITLRQIVLKL